MNTSINRRGNLKLNNSGKSKNISVNNSYLTRSKRFIYDTEGNFSAVNIFYLLIFITIIILIIYFGYNFYYSSDKKVVYEESVPNIIDTKIQYSIAGSSVPSSEYSNEYSISFWLKVDEYNYRYGEEKVILRRGTGTNMNPELSLGAKDNTLTARIGLQTQMREQFEDIRDSKPSCLDFQAVSDNNPKLDVAMEGMFGSVSGNDVVPLNKMVPWIDMTNAEYKGTTGSCVCGQEQLEGFMDVKDLDGVADMISSLLVIICDFMNSVSDPDTAKLMLSLMDMVFNHSIQKIESGVQVSSSDIENAKITEMVTTYLGNNTNTKLKNDVVSFMVKLQELEAKMASMTTEPTSEEKDYMIQKINAKLKEVKCELELEAIDLSGSGKKLELSIIKLLRKSIYQFIYNMGVEVAKQHGNEIIMEEGRLSDKMGMCQIREFPLQKWTHVVLTQYNQNINLYQDGQLVSSCILKGFPMISTDDIVLFPEGGLAGKLSRLVYINMALNQSQIESLYNDGPVKQQAFYQTIPTWILLIITVIITIIIVLLVVA